MCAETAQSPWTDALPRVTNAVDERAAWRVGFLRLAVRITGAIWGVMGYFLWDRYQEQIPVAFLHLADWIPTGLVRFGLLVTLVAVALWMMSATSKGGRVTPARSPMVQDACGTRGERSDPED